MSIGTNERPATIVSSPLRPTGQNRAWVRPHAQGCLVIRMMSSERKRTIGVTGLSSEVATSSPSSPSATCALVPGVLAAGSTASSSTQSSQAWQPSCWRHSHAPVTSPVEVHRKTSTPQLSSWARARAPSGSPAKAAPLNEENTSRMSVVRLRWSSSASASPVSCA